MEECFCTADPAQALRIAQERTEEYDHCWWKQEDGGYQTLMTSTTLSAFEAMTDGRFLRFPRMALGPNALQNGWRRYPVGDGKELTSADRQVLLQVYLDTRQGIRLSLATWLSLTIFALVIPEKATTRIAPAKSTLAWLVPCGTMLLLTRDQRTSQSQS